MWPHWLRSIDRRLTAWLGAPPADAAGGPQPRAQFEELEPRLLYSADSPGAWLASATVPSAVVQVVQPAAPVVPVVSSAATFAYDNATPNPDANAEPNIRVENGQPAQRREIVFVDAAVPDAQALIDALRAQRPAHAEIEIVAIRTDADALSQIDAVLQGEHGLDAVHIISHGDAGRLWIGNGLIDESTLLARQGAFGAWRGALSAQADLLLWGCDVAAGAQGESFIARFAQLTGADVAASTDATGHPSLGGDWSLEAHTGEVAGQAALGASFQAQWVGLLPSYQQFTHYTGQSEISSTAHWGQTFTHTSGGGTYSVNQVSLALKRDAGAPAQSITVELRSSWNGGVLGSATVNSTVLGTSFAMVDLSFSGMVLTDGTAYTLRVRSDSPAGAVYLGTNPSGGYAGGTKLDVNGAVLGGEDLAFRVASIQGPTVDASSSVATDGVVSVNLAHTTSGSNRLMLVSVATDPHGERASAVTYDGVNLSLFGVEELAGNHSRVEIWSLVAPSTGTNNVVVTMTGTAYRGVAVGVMTYNGVNQTAPLLDFGSASGSSAAAAVSVASAQNDFVFAVVHSHSGTGAVPGAGQTEYWDVISDQSNGGASGQPGASSVTSSWTVDNGDWSAAAVSIQADSQTTMTLATTVVKDAYIEQSNPTSNHGSLASMVVDRKLGGLQRALVQFDLSALAANAVIVSAALKLEASAIGGALNLSVYQLQQSWTEAGVTWNESSSGVNWSVAGGAFNATALDTFSTAAAGMHRWDVTSLAQAWVAGTQQNHGLMVASADGGGNLTVSYNSREGAFDPVFEIVYFVPNTAPIATNLSAAETYTEDSSRNLIDIVIADPDPADTITATLTLSSSAAGSLNTGTAGAATSTYSPVTGVWSASGVLADVNSLLAALTFTPASNYHGNFSIATSVSDGAALAASGSKAMIGTAVNDAPVATNLSAVEAYNEDTSVNLINIVVSDVDSANITATLTLSDPGAGGLLLATSGAVSSTYVAGTGVWTASGALADVNTLLAGVTYLPAAHYNASFTIATRIGDDVAPALTGTKVVTGTPVNDAAQITTTGSTLAYSENGAALTLDTGLLVGDVDNSHLAGATITIAANFASGQDVLAFSNQNGISGSWNVGTGVLTLTGSATVTHYQTALRSITYVNTSDDPGTAVRTVAFLVNDGSTNSAAATRDISVTAVNDAPLLGTSGSILAYAENDAAMAVDSGLTLADTDNATIASAAVSISANYDSGQDLLLFSNQLGITGSWNSTTGVLTLSGASSVASYQTALRSVSYLNNSEAPDVALRSVAFEVSDGALTSAAATRDVQVAAVNDAPVLDSSAAMMLTTIGRTHVNSPGNTVAQVIGSVGGDRITDVDSAALEGVALTSTTTGGLGQWQYSLDGGGNWTPVAALNTSAALLLRDIDRVRFVPNGAANGQATLTFRAWDRSSGGVGTLADASSGAGTQPYSAAVESASINVVENTAGSVAVADSAPTQVGVSVAINVLGNDLDPQGDPLSVLDISNPANGTVSLGAGGTITYMPDGGFSGSDNFNYRISDGNQGLANYWKLDGHATDSVGGSNGALMNGPTTVRGAFGQALQFDGVNDHVVLPDLSYTNEFTLSFRFRVDDNSGSVIQYFYSHGPAPGTGLPGMVHVGLVENGNAVLMQRNHLVTSVFDGNDTVDGSGQLLVDVAALIGDGQWHQYTATVTPGIGTQVYIDGTLRGSVDRGGDAINPAGSVYLGARSDLDSTRYLNAGSRMDSLALFNQALTSTEAGDLWSGGSSQAAVTVSVNAAPVLTASGGSANCVENAAATAVDGGLTVGDANSATLVGARVSISSNYTPGQDQLQFSNQPGISGSWNAGTGELTLSGSASVADYQTALRAVTFVNSSDNPVTAPRVLSFVVDDGQAPSLTVTRSLTVTAVNDAPTAAGLNTAESYTEDSALNLADIVISDVDHAIGSATLTLSNAAAGALSTATSGAVSATYNAGTGVWTASGALADVNVLLAGVSFTPSSNFNGGFSIATQADDGVAAPVTGSKAFSGVPVNDAPTATNLSAAETCAEDTPLNLVDIVVSDVDSAVITARLTLSDAAAGALSTATSGAVTSTYGSGTGVWTASGANADVNALLAGLVFTPATNYTAGFAVSTSISDGVAPAITGSKAFVVSPVNDAATAINLDAAETYIEDTPLNLTDIVVSDVDSASATATLTLSNAGAGSLGTATSGAVTATYDTGTGVWTASGLMGDVNALLAGLTFTPAPDFNGGFSVATRVDDGVAAAITGSKSFTGTAINDAPVASNLSAAESYTEDAALNLADIVASDIDGSSGTVTLTLSNPAAGLLGTGSSGAVSSSYSPATGVWTAGGAWADINVLLAALSFTPTPDFNGPFNIATSVSDGVAAPVTGSKLFTGVPVNDTPTASNLSAAESYIEDQPLDLTDIVIGDIDSPTLTATLTLSNPAAGALTAGISGAVSASYNAGTGVWVASGARADVNALLARLRLVPAPDFNGFFTLATRVDDGVAAALLGNKSFTGVAVNDAPTGLNLSASEVYTEDTPLDLADIVINDVDHSTGSATLTLSDPTVGVLSTGSSGAVSARYNAATGVWTASGALVDLNALLAALTFTPQADFTGSFNIGTSLSDGVAAPVTGMKLFTAAAVNDAPTATNLGAGQTYIEDQLLDLTDIVVGDIDSASVTATLTLSNAAAGTLSTGVSGAVTSTFNAAAGVWTASGTLADVNALLASVVFSPAPDFNADFSIATALDDGVAAALTGVKPFKGVPVNDAPTAAGLDNAEVYTEDKVLKLSNIVVADVDSAALTATLTLSDATVGALSTPVSGTVTTRYDPATGVWSASGAVADVNAVLAAVQFTPALNFNGTFSVATRVSDGLAAPLAGAKLFTGVPVNDAPVLAFIGSLAVGEGSVSALGAAQLRATDVDDGAAQLIYTVLTAPAHGTVLLGAAALASGGTFTQADLDAGRLAYRHDSSETTADRLEFSLGDGQSTAATGQLPITVLPVNDEVPRITSLASGATVSVSESQTAVTRVTAFDADLPAQTLTFAIAGGADAVHFSIDGTTGDLHFIRSPDYERPQDVDGDNLYRVDLRVTDGALSSTHSVVVAVLPENDSTPQITSSGGSAQAALEVQEGNTAVVTLTATDADRPTTALTYSVAGGADAARFFVDAASGALRFVEAPLAIDPRDRDRNNLYEVVVQVSDGTLLVQQALRVQVRAAPAAFASSTPPATNAPAAPAPYAGSDAAAEVSTSSSLVLKDLLPSARAEEVDEAASWNMPAAGRRRSLLRLLDGAGSGSADGVQLATAAQQLAAEAAAALAAGTDGLVQTWSPSQDTQSLEAALGLPSSEPAMLQVRPGGLSLAALASQAATRSSTAIPGQLAPTLPTGGEGRTDDDSDSLVEALATPVVAGGLAFSATLLLWATRAGGLVAAMMASMPAWRSLDPLPILERADKRDQDDGADGVKALTGTDPSSTPPALDDDPAAASQPPSSAPRPGTLRDLIEPMEMLR